jgi:Dolichyl-phosphate-mannose-protein mannosyltransferase
MIPFINKSSYSQKFFALLTGFFCFRLVVALLLPLSPQETYYWVFSLHPALSYFDHPPLTAYTIFFFSRIFGQTALAVRLGALLYSFGTGWLVFAIGKRLFTEKTGFLAGSLMNLLPIFSITGLIMTPDCPLLFFWCLSLFFIVKAIQDDGGVNYLWSGIALGLALISKYTAVFIPLSLFLFLITSPLYRHHLKKKEAYGGLVLALLVFSPVLFWNARHQWASLAFQSTQRIGEMKAFHWEEMGAFLSSQIGIITPLVFGGFCWGIGLGVKRFWRIRPWPEALLLSFVLPMAGLFTLVATREWVKMNWLIPAYPPLLLLTTAYYQNRAFAWKWIYGGYAKWTWVSALVFFILFHLWPFIPQIPVSGSTDTMTGWKGLADYLEKIKNSPEIQNQKPLFVFAWGHKTASELQFYLKGHPATFTQTVLGEKVLAYDYWSDPKPLEGENALFVWSEFDRFPEGNSNLLKRYFDGVEELEPFTVFRGRRRLRTFHIYLCVHYKGLS